MAGACTPDRWGRSTPGHAYLEGRQDITEAEICIVRSSDCTARCAPIREEHAGCSCHPTGGTGLIRC